MNDVMQYSEIIKNCFFPKHFKFLGTNQGKVILEGKGGSKCMLAISGSLPNVLLVL